MKPLLLDIDGILWKVSYLEPTPHGFDVARGVRADQSGKRSIQVVLTIPLANYIQRVTRWSAIDLPIGVDALRRLRAKLEVGYSDRRSAWWQQRVDDLRTLSAPAFARKHDVSVNTVNTRRQQLLGTLQPQRPAGWWKEPAVAQLLLGLPVAEAAAHFGLTRSTVHTYRTRLGAGQLRRERWGTLAEAAAYVPSPTNPDHSRYLADTHYGITRTEYRPNRWAWDVHLSRRGQLHSRRFTDLQHNGAEPAMAAAQAHRDALLRDTRPLTRREYCQIPRSTNTTGHAGVHRSTRRGVLYFVAHTRLPGGGVASMSFSTRRLGHDHALRQAVAERQRQLRQVTGVYVHSPAAQRFHDARGVDGGSAEPV